MSRTATPTTWATRWCWLATTILKLSQVKDKPRISNDFTSNNRLLCPFSSLGAVTQWNFFLGFRRMGLTHLLGGCTRFTTQNTTFTQYFASQFLSVKLTLDKIITQNGPEDRRRDRFWGQQPGAEQKGKSSFDGGQRCKGEVYFFAH